jgi:hypothetical protein
MAKLCLSQNKSMNPCQFKFFSQEEENLTPKFLTILNSSSLLWMTKMLQRYFIVLMFYNLIESVFIKQN